jgi:glyoxylate utilization-related uncharacterized protein
MEPIHIHPKQENTAEIISGKLHFMVNGVEQILGSGGKIVIPAGLAHRFWNENDEEVHSRQQFSPALTVDEFIETFFTFVNDDKLNNEGMPSVLQLPLMGLKHKNDIRVTNPALAFLLVIYLI